MKYFEVKNLCYSYYKQPLCLKDISFSADKNEKILILAKDDMGKSTLLNAVSLFDTKSFGAIYLNGQDARKIADNEKNFSLILEQPALIAGTIRKNIDILTNHLNCKRLTDSCLNAFLKLFHIDADSDTKVKHLSQEDKIKLTLLRSYIKNPDIVFADDIFKFVTEKEKNNFINDIKMIIRDKTAFIAMSDSSFLKNQALFDEIHFDKILYLNFAECKIYDDIMSFEKDLPDLNSLDFFNSKVVYDAVIERVKNDYYFVKDALQFKFDKSFYKKLDALKLSDGEEDSIVFYTDDAVNIDVYSNEKFNDALKDKSLKLFSRLDGCRVI